MRKPFGRQSDFFQQWKIVTPPEISGYGVGSEHSDFIPIEEPQPSNDNLLSVPGMKLWTDGGGLIRGYVEFWSDEFLLSQHEIACLDCTVHYTPYSLGGATGNTTQPNGWTHETGTFYGDWSMVYPVIPAGRGKIFGVSAYMAGGAFDPQFIYPPYTQHITYTSYLELGDIDENVLATIEVATHHWEYNTSDLFNFTQDVAAVFESGQSISVTADIVKKRCKMVVTANHYCQPYCRILTGAYVEMEA